jgi:hypothetical protein
MSFSRLDRLSLAKFGHFGMEIYYHFIGIKPVFRHMYVSKGQSADRIPRNKGLFQMTDIAKEVLDKWLAISCQSSVGCHIS